MITLKNKKNQNIINIVYKNKIKIENYISSYKNNRCRSIEKIEQKVSHLSLTLVSFSNKALMTRSLTYVMGWDHVDGKN